MNNHNTKLYGISGVARAGKDTFAATLVKIISEEDLGSCQIISFADALKSDIDDFLLDRVGISAYTQDTDQKSIIRPLLVAYGMTMRTIDPMYWVNKVRIQIEDNIRNSIISLITDVRFPNEVNFIKDYPCNSCVVHLNRTDSSNKLIQPANSEEAENDPLCAELSNVDLTWPTFGSNEEEYLTFVKDCFWF